MGPNELQAETLASILPRAEEPFRQWLENDICQDDPQALQYAMENPEVYLEYLQEWLQSEKSIDIREDGLIEFWWLNEGCDQIIVDLPVALYHFTSSVVVNKITRSGLHGNGKRVNPYQNSGAGVYLTTEGSGPAVNGYVRNAIQGHGRRGSGVRITVKMYLAELEEDPDDADISSGSHQFVVAYIAPDRIISIDPA